MKIGHPSISSTGAPSSNELQGLDYMTGYQEIAAPKMAIWKHTPLLMDILISNRWLNVKETYHTGFTSLWYQATEMTTILVKEALEDRLLKRWLLVKARPMKLSNAAYTTCSKVPLCEKQRKQTQSVPCCLPTDAGHSRGANQHIHDSQDDPTDACHSRGINQHIHTN